MTTLSSEFLKVMDQSFKAYNKSGARSPKKLLPIHQFLSKVILKNLNNNYSIKSLGIGDGKEVTIEGKYYPKDLDIAVIKDKKIVATISVKFVTSNYQQNANNYFEGLMGETANIRRSNVGFAHFIVFRGHTPYYSKNKGNLRGEEKKKEILSERYLQKYVKLFKDMDFPHKPDLIGICVLDFDKKKKAHYVNFNDFDFSDTTKALLCGDFSLDIFLDKFVHLVSLKS